MILILIPTGVSWRILKKDTLNMIIVVDFSKKHIVFYLTFLNQRTMSNIH